MKPKIAKYAKVKIYANEDRDILKAFEKRRNMFGPIEDNMRNVNESWNNRDNNQYYESMYR